MDAGFIFGSGIKNVLAEPDYLLDLYTIPTLDTDASWWDQNAVSTFEFGGALKTITGDISLYSNFAPMLYYFNKEVAGSNNITDPCSESDIRKCVYYNHSVCSRALS